MKNWDLLLSGPLLANDTIPLLSTNQRSLNKQHVVKGAYRVCDYYQIHPQNSHPKYFHHLCLYL